MTIYEKHADARPGAGQVTDLCRSEAVLETQTPLEHYADLRMNIGGKLFAEVTDRLEKCFAC